MSINTKSIVSFARKYLFSKFKGKMQVSQIKAEEFGKNGALKSVPTGETYSLVLLSHMLYYRNKAEWVATSNAAYNFVAPGGAMAIIVHGDEGQVAELVTKSGGNLDDINGFAYVFARDFGWNAHFYKTLTRHQAYSQAGLGALMDFFAMDTAAKGIADLEAYRTESGIYEITKYDKMIVVFKPEGRGVDYSVIDAHKPTNRRGSIFFGLG